MYYNAQSGGTPGFRMGTSFKFPYGVLGLRAADYDGDGFPDIGVASGNEVRLIGNLGGVSFDEQRFRLAWDPKQMPLEFGRALVSYDVDGDGRLDLIALFSNSMRSHLFVNLRR